MKQSKRRRKKIIPSYPWCTTSLNVFNLTLGKSALLLLRSMDKDSQDVYQELNELKSKFQAMRKLVGNMPGIDMSPEEQQRHLQSLREQVQTKSELLQKYKSLCMFEIPKE
ncbi:mediator of RNA polymerase II transcription subunit 9 isoform X1 [Xenopus laevis]|uniref:Mediator of RNA polymerase II transcription subunit 9 n=1 Tax=Xenopus laevis TaxID=8355 RepID=A0A8J1LQ37_XENLA|nr:mediator of RNA polymerase II transcription subunit 9 isoform X1 [Xenopus laevis]